MILYHGTSLSRGLQILKDKAIKKDAPKVYDEKSRLPTTNGYVYLTEDLANAIYYGNKTALLDEDSELMIFEVDLPYSSIEPDIDEINYTLRPFGKVKGFNDIDNPTVEESIKNAHSIRFPHDITFGDSLKRYARIYTSKYTSTDDDRVREKRDLTYDIVSLAHNYNAAAIKAKDKLLSKIQWKVY